MQTQQKLDQNSSYFIKYVDNFLKVNAFDNT